MSKKLIKSGTCNQPAGTYQEVGAHGGKIPHGLVITIAQGEVLPDTQKPDHRWEKK
ncbi:YjzC family protein [uncultured Cetobacterium sp.]|uniref:YjzC family protein n=1 Tax=uncultured Cetobacterium sp. TaxID=527638 RepID=UPI002618AC1E|nr:YjzC family protein [uncultured Cetobacterium sp.]